MRLMKWIGLLAGMLTLVACFMPWVVIESRGLTLTGMQTEGTNFGKPGLLHLILSGFFLIFHFTPRVWAKRLNLVVAALNAGWALRNFLVIAGCQAGECPVRQLALYLLALSVLLQLAASLLPSMPAR